MTIRLFFVSLGQVSDAHDIGDPGGYDSQPPPSRRRVRRASAVGQKHKASRAGERRAADDFESRAEAVRGKLAAGRTTGALQDAKRLAKTDPGPVADELLADAYAARVADLSTAGLAREAAELLGVARARFPERAARWDECQRADARRAGDIGELLREWAAPGVDESLRAALAEELERAITEPSRVASAAELAPDDPLQVAALAVAFAFAEAAAGALTPAGRARLRDVGRRSPLRPWRSLVLALATAHDGDADAARTHLAAVPPESGAGLLAPVLDGVLAGRAPGADAGPHERRLFANATGGRAALADAVPALDQALRRRDQAAIRAWLSGPFVQVVRIDRQLAYRLLRWCFAEDVLDAENTRFAFALVPPGEADRLWALESRFEPREAAAAFAAFLGPRLASPRVPPQQNAQALDWLADRVAECWEPIEARLEHLLGGVDLTGARAAERAAVALWSDDASADSDLDGVLVHALGDVLRRLPDPEPTSGRDPVERLRTRARELAPSEARFRAACERAAGRGDRALRGLCDAWRQAFPRSIEPLLRLERVAELDRDWPWATELLAEARAIDPVHQELRDAEFRVGLGHLHEHLHRGDRGALAGDFARLQALPAAASPERRAYLAAARSVAAADPAASDLPVVEPASGEWSAHELEAMVRCLVADREGEAVELAAGTRAEQVRALCRILRVAESVATDAASLVRVPGGLADVGPEDLPQDGDSLLTIARFALARGFAPLLYTAAGVGLSRDGPALARFVAFRWRALRLERRRQRGVAACLALAHALAQARQDRDALRLLNDGGAGIHELRELDHAEVARLLERERALRGPLRDRARELDALRQGGPGSRPRRGRSRRSRPIDRTGMLPFQEPPPTDA
jgi:hypothetical protein